MSSAVLQLTDRGEGASAAEKAEQVVLVGRIGDERRDATTRAAARANAGSRTFETVEQAERALREGPPPKCIFVDSDVADLAAFVSWLRGEGRLFSVPVVVQVDEPSNSAFVEAHAVGADDCVIAGDKGAITRRLANLDKFDPSMRPPLTQGGALIGHADEQHRRVLGRILRQAGFDVSFAGAAEELSRVAGRAAEAPALLVVSHELAGEGPLSAIEAVREATGLGELPAVVLAQQGSEREIRTEAEALGSVAVTGESAPADNLLFLANELMRPGVKDVRASTRLLHGTLCGFRPAGTLRPVYGLTYNISREGLYVRTLDPPVPGTDLWFELHPPYATAAAHLRGKVVWSRGMDSPGGAAPPGFGMRIEEQACPSGDLETYRESYQALHDEIRLIG